MKDFKEHFWMFYNKISNDENFALLRFSDGELRIMQNLKLVLDKDHYVIGNQKKSGFYSNEDLKYFDPNQHSFFHNHLMESYKFKHPKYFSSISCRCCVGEKDFLQMLEWYDGDTNSDNLTWANIWVNSNYPLFVKYVIPLLKKKEKKGIIYVLNENGNINNLPFKIKKDFRVGKNCIINDYDLIGKMKDWVVKNKIKNNIFLFSASSLSNVLQYELFKIEPENIYIDVGTCFNKHLNLDGRRGYLSGGSSLNKTCIW